MKTYNRTNYISLYKNMFNQARKPLIRYSANVNRTCLFRVYLIIVIHDPSQIKLLSKALYKEKNNKRAYPTCSQLLVVSYG